MNSLDIQPNETGDEYTQRLGRENPELWGAKYIYALIDPVTHQARYIGKTVRPRERLQNHMNEKSNCHRSHWLQKLKAQGLVPQMVILEEIRGEWPWQEAERHWIARARREGWPLVNNTAGGDGAPNLPPETRERIRLASVGRKATPEQIARAVAARAGYRASEETKAKMSAAQKGRVITWTDQLAEAIRKFSLDEVAIIKARLDAGERTGKLAEEFGVHRTTISKIKMGTYHLRYRRNGSVA